MGTIQLAVVIGLIVAVMGAAMLLPQGGSGTTTTSTSASTSTTTDTCSAGAAGTDCVSTSTTMSFPNDGPPASTDAASVQGLQLRVSISSDSVYFGQSVQVNVSEFNTLGASNNVTKSDDWAVQASLGACPNVYVQPMGVALYQGHVTGQNLSQGAQVQIYPPTACPMFIRLVTGYVFQPASDVAAVLPGSGETPMNGTVDLVNGTSTMLGQTTPPNPGEYTLVAVDEWGAVAFLYFQVNGLP